MGKGYKNLIPKDPKVHSESAMGRKQPQRIGGIARSYNTPHTVSMSGHNYSFSKEGNKIELSLGNMTDAGWYWTGDQDDMVGFFARISSSQIKDEVLKDFEESRLSYKDMKPILLKSAQNGSGMYQITGDNKLWHFGESFLSEPSEEINEFLDSMTQDDNIELTDKLRERFFEIFEYPNMDYDDFEKEYKKEYIKDATQAVNESQSYGELMDKMDNLREGWLEQVMDYEHDLYSDAESEAYAKFKKELGVKEIVSVIKSDGKGLALGQFKSVADAERFIGRKKGLEVKSIEVIPEPIRKKEKV